MGKLKIAIIFGGRAEEHFVSLKSAREVVDHLDTEKYEPFYVGITQDGEWKLCDGPDENWETGNCRPVILSPDSSVRGLLIQDEKGYKPVRIDVVLPVLHGRLGEGGSMQGLLELSGIPYVGCDVQSSVLSMDKSLAYVVVKNAGIATPAFKIVMMGEKVNADELSYPVVVKPARSGSSFGVTKVSKKEDLQNAIETAGKYDSKVLIEDAVVGTEVGCAVLGNGADLRVGEVDQIRLSHGIFRIHQEDDPEHGSENSTITVPAEISAETRLRVLETAKAIYRALGCRGLARVDMFLKEDGNVVLNEVNTFPGLTSYSRYPRMMAAAGVSFTEMINRMVALALEEEGGK